MFVYKCHTKSNEANVVARDGSCVGGSSGADFVTVFARV
jgi:hypothetical protein